jgi:hypothetical protein
MENINIDPRMQLPSNIEELANKICQKINDIESNEQKLADDKKSLELWKNELSEMLDNSGYAVGSKISLKNGRRIELKQFFRASIPSETSIEKCRDEEQRQDLISRKKHCFDWLENNNLGGIIKNSIIVSLPKGAQKIAKEISNYLNSIEVDYSQEVNVHHSTLNATLKEAISKGINIPTNIFEVNAGTAVEIK